MVMVCGCTTLCGMGVLCTLVFRNVMLVLQGSGHGRCKCWDLCVSGLWGTPLLPLSAKIIHAQTRA